MNVRCMCTYLITNLKSRRNRRRIVRFEHGNYCSVFHILVTTRLIQFVRRKSCSRFWGVWLDGVSFVNQIFLVQLRQQPPNGFHVFWFVGDVWIFHVYPIPHFHGEVIPDIGVTHDCFSTSVVILIDTDFRSDIFFGNSKFFFHAKFNR